MKQKRSYNLTEGEPLSAGNKKNECRNERCPVGAESELLGRAELRHRFLEESLELVQSLGCTKGEAYQLVDYVFDRAVGESSQEVGGVMVTLAALCLANRMDMHEAGEIELARTWTKIDEIRAKQAMKPRNSPPPATLTPGGVAKNGAAGGRKKK